MAITNSSKEQKYDRLINPETQTKVPFAIVEAYKSIRTNLISSLANDDAKIIAISSPNASEGKSTTTVNIAIALSQLNKKVLIIDADARRPTIHQKMRLENVHGCVSVLNGEARLDSVIQSYNPFLDVITTGSRSSNPSELFSSPAFDEMLEDLRDQYDYILLDTPPVNLVADTLVIAQKCDGLVFVVRTAVTTYDAFSKAKESVATLGIKLYGVIMNGSDNKSGSYYKYKKYQSGSYYY